jgi:peptide/nickel transport system ATP-binding protein
VADDVAVMNSGRICEHGTVSEVLRAPKDPYTVRLLVDAPKMPTTAGAPGQEAADG